MKRACVLLSTFNGERFLEKQLQSLLCQSHQDLEVLVRDDGSTDQTKDILESYARRDPRLSFDSGKNVGPVESFLRMLGAAPEDRSGYFFCDQDDIWHEDKIKAALDAMSSRRPDGPVLYCSRLRYVDEHGETVGLSRIPSAVGLGNALVENSAIGCTIAMNEAGKFLVSGLSSRAIIMHDWWAYLVISALGEIVYDPIPRIDYRLHSSNSVGAGVTWMERWCHRLRGRRARKSDTISRAMQAEALLETCGNRLNIGSRALLNEFVAGKRKFSARLRMVALQKIRRTGFLDQVVLCAQILANDY